MGTRPLVHVGFLKSWLAGGLNDKVISAVLKAVQQCRQRLSLSDKVTVFVTGESSTVHCVCTVSGFLNCTFCMHWFMFDRLSCLAHLLPTFRKQRGGPYSLAFCSFIGAVGK